VLLVQSLQALMIGLAWVAATKQDFFSNLFCMCVKLIAESAQIRKETTIVAAGSMAKVFCSLWIFA